MPGGEKLSRTRERAIASLLTANSIEAAATAAGVSERSLRGWLKQPEFKAAYRVARRKLIEMAIGRIQAATGEAVDTLMKVAKDGAKDSDRVRAAAVLLDYAFRGLTEADTLHGERETGDRSPMDTGDVVKL